MTHPDQNDEVRTIVVPKALEDFFADKLRDRYATRGDVRVVVDRRHGERRDGDEQLDADRRAAERRILAGWWSLPEMPYTAG